MKRRDFAKKTLIAVAGITLIPPMVKCSSGNLDVKNLIGKDESILGDKQKTGNDYFGYFIFKGNEITSDFKAEKIFIITENKKIIGYTLIMAGTDAGVKASKELQKVLGNPSKEIDNYYGKQASWEKEKTRIAVTISHALENLPQKTWYSEHQSGMDLIVF